ncbi:MAG: glutathione peroxidase [Candidatus Thorarchaeota archaeon]
MSLYDLTVKDIDGNQKHLMDFKGKPLLIVNVASECGFTPQYKELQELHEKYKDKVHILAFPCNQFGKQEPGTDSEIKEFATSKFNVTFPMFSKIDVKGPNISPVYKYLNSNSNDEPKWNFHKYLVNKEGTKILSFPSQVNPLDEKILNELE